MNPLEHPEAYKFVLGGTAWIGEARLSGHERKPTWDKKPAKGQSGATSTLVSPDSVGEFEVEFIISGDPSQPDEFAAWDEFQKIVESTVAGTKPRALAVYHPDLARNHFTAVSHNGIGGMSYDGKGGASVKVKFIEYKPPRPKPAAKATSSATSPRNAQRPDPNAALKAKVAALKTQAKAL